MKMFRLMVVLVLSMLICGCTEHKQIENGSAVEKAVAPLPKKAKPAVGAESLPPAPASVLAPAPPPKLLSKPMPRPVAEPTRAERVAATAARAPIPAGAAPVPEKPESLHQYAVKVSATSPITMDMNKTVKSAGQLVVWVGQPGYEPSTPAGMATAREVLETGTKAESARITPVFSDPLAFDADPKESKCQLVEPKGSEVTFAITPNKSGDFKVGASVELYKSEGCTGAAITRSAEPITVKVTVAVSAKPFLQGIFDAFMKFFYEILGVCAAALVFLLRKKIFPFMDKS